MPSPATPIPAAAGARLHRRRACLGALLAVGTAALGACATRERVVVQERLVAPPPPPVRIRAMPAQVREDRGPAPGPGANWVPGHWVWQGNDWAWIHGHWVQQPVAPMPALIVETVPAMPPAGQYWVPGHWAWRPATGGWAWVKGAWR